MLNINIVTFMISSIFSQQIDQGLKDFLWTTFHTTNPFFHRILGMFLADEGTLSRGPYVSLQLPFQKGESKEFFFHVPLGFTPYRHYEQAIARLSGTETSPSIWPLWTTFNTFHHRAQREKWRGILLQKLRSACLSISMWKEWQMASNDSGFNPFVTSVLFVVKKG